jgi:hypothetical protein
MENETRDELNTVFGGKWCFCHTKAGTSIEGQVKSVSNGLVMFDQMFVVYNEIPRIRNQKAQIEHQAVVIPWAEVDLLRTSDRAETEDFCRKLNVTHLVQGVVPPNNPRGRN